jgi:hypothetical protein
MPRDENLSFVFQDGSDLEVIYPRVQCFAQVLAIAAAKKSQKSWTLPKSYFESRKCPKEGQYMRYKIISILNFKEHHFILPRCLLPLRPQEEAISKIQKSIPGVCFPYDRKKKQCVPAALKCLRMKAHRKYCKLGDLSTSVGWKCQGLLKKLEDRRRVRAGKFFNKKKAVIKATANGKKAAKLNAGEKAIVASVSA